MKKFFTTVLVLLVFASTSMIAQDLDKILEKYYKTIGIEKILKTKTIVSKGKVQQQGMEYPMTLYQKRPGKIRMEAEIQGAKIIQAFDGDAGWGIMPFTGSSDPQEMPADQINRMKQMADMEGDLYNWKEKGYILTLDGEEDLEGARSYKLLLEKKGGEEFTYFIDAEKLVVVRIDSDITVQGTPIQSSSYYSDFRPVDKMMVPFAIETRINDMMQLKVVIEEYKTNEKIDDNIFARPPASE